MLVDENDKCLQSNKISSFESLSTSQKGELETYVRALIQGYVQGNKEPFMVSDIVGGRFSHWGDTPLAYIYDYHKNRCITNPSAEAGKDIGRIFKYIMVNDRSRKYRIAKYVQRQFLCPTYEYVGQQFYYK